MTRPDRVRGEIDAVPETMIVNIPTGSRSSTNATIRQEEAIAAGVHVCATERTLGGVRFPVRSIGAIERTTVFPMNQRCARVDGIGRHNTGHAGVRIGAFAVHTRNFSIAKVFRAIFSHGAVVG